MNRQVQKETEKFYAEQFSKLMKYNWNIIIPDNEEEYPDLLINTDVEIFGLEVRESLKSNNKIKGSHIKKKEKYNLKMMQRLSSNYYNKSDRPIGLKLYGKIDENNFNKILGVLLNNSVKDGNVSSHYIPSPNGLISIYITGLPIKFRGYSQWTNLSDSFGFVDFKCEKSVEELINQKSANLPKYQKNIDKVSLLIYANHKFNSGQISFENIMNINKYGFQNIYLYEYPEHGYKY